MARSQDNDDEPMNIALEIEMVAEELGDVVSLLSGDGRDFLVRNNGVKIPIANLEGQVVALYFSASWCGPCSRFTPELVEVYNELLSNTNKFEVVFVSADQDKDSFNGYLSKMPWLAIPFSDNGTRKKLNQLFKVRGMPHLVILDSSGKILNEEGVLAVKDYGVQGYPFSAEKIRKLREDEEAAKKEQTIRSLLVSPARDYVISNDKSKVPVSDLEGKIVALYFSDNEFRPCVEFTPVLAQIYGKLKERGERFEVVLVPLDDDESSFEEAFARMPWLTISFQDKSCNQLARYFELSYIPTVAVIGADGKTMNVDFAELIEEHGVEAWEAFPFSQEKLDPLSEKAKAKQEAQTLESLLVSGDLDYVLGHDGKKVPVKELVGKNILLYFSSHLCPPCQAFLPKLKEEYHKIKNKDNACEVVLIAKDFSQADFEEFYSDMPWLALPFGDERKKNLRRVFKIRSIPFLVAIDPTGKTVTKEATYLLSTFGADAYPFSEDRIKELEARIEEMAKEWPEKITLELHEHELVRTRCRMYGCAECGQTGNSWSFRCIRCEFDLHPKCALEHKEKEKATSGGEQGRAMAAENGEGYVCDGEVCRKV